MMLQYLVQRKGSDPTAETCLHALQSVMQLPVTQVQVGSLWRFVFDAESPASDTWNEGAIRRRIEQAAQRSGRYVNVNRDVGSWLPAATDTTQPPTGERRADILVLDGDGVDAVALRYFRSLDIGSLMSVVQGTLFRVRMDVSSLTEVCSIAEKIMKTQSRHDGFLSNPHAQESLLLGVWE